jgi:Dolichyl-phosphate-mannose-protein mannosyltransferase
MLKAVSSNRRLPFLVFIFFFFVNLTSSGGHLDPFDGVQSFLVTESMVLKHSAKLYPDIPSIEKLHWDVRVTDAVDPNTKTVKPTYQDKGLLISAVSTPFYYAALFFSASPISVVPLFVNSMIISLIAVVIFYFSLEIYRSKKIAFVLSLIFGVCSFAWPYISTFEAQPLQTLCIITAAYFIYLSTRDTRDTINKNNSNNKAIYFPSLGGILLGFSIFAHPASIVVIPGFIAYVIFVMRRNKKSIISFLVSLGIIIIFVGLVNYWRYGSFTDFGYGVYTQHEGWTGLIGLLISPGSGIIFYFPIVILLPLAFKYMYNMEKRLFFLFIYILVATWLMYGTLSDIETSSWNGSVSWGPRYFISILPFITIASGTLLLNLKNRLFLKTTIITLCVAGFFVNLLGILIWYDYGYSYGLKVGGLMKYEVPPNNRITPSFMQYNRGVVTSSEFITYVPNYSPIILHLGALISNYPSHIQITPAFLNSYWSYGNAPCSYDLYIYCKFGTIPILFLSAAIVFIANLIVIEIYNFNLILRIRNTITKGNMQR